MLRLFQLVFLALCALLVSCNGAGPNICDRAISDAARTPPPFGIAGRELRFDVSAPLLGCWTDALSATVEAYDATNLRVPATVENLRMHEGEVTGTVSLTPTTEGIHFVRVAFEPSLGLVSIEVGVGIAPDVEPVTEVFPLPTTDCMGKLQRTLSGAVLCPIQAPYSTTIVFRGGVEEARISAYSPVVTEDTVWSINVDGVLQRRVDRDGGLMIEGELAGLKDATQPVGEHRPDFAIRALVSGIRKFSWDGGTLAATGPEPRGQIGGFEIIEGDASWDVVGFGSLRRTDSDGEVAYLGAPVLGADRDGVWTFDGETLVLWRRPFREGALLQLRTPVPDGFEAREVGVFGSAEASRPPLFVSRSGSGDILLPRLSSRGLYFECWFGIVGTLFVSDEWIVARDADPKILRFWRRPPRYP